MKKIISVLTVVGKDAADFKVCVKAKYPARLGEIA